MAKNIVLIVEQNAGRAAMYVENVSSSGSGHMLAKTPAEALRTLEIAPGINELCIAGLYYTKHRGIEHLKELIRIETEAD